MELVYYPDPVLRRRAAPVERIDDELRDRVREMFDIMHEHGGVGLAAPQVNWSTRLFVMDPSGREDTADPRAFVNPRILAAEGEAADEEGCLSIPDVRGRVTRHERIRISAQDLDGRVFEDSLEGLPARVFQHELDHLDGILFLVHLSSSDRILVRKTLRRLEKEHQKRTAVRR